MYVFFDRPGELVPEIIGYTYRTATIEPCSQTSGHGAWVHFIDLTSPHLPFKKAPITRPRMIIYYTGESSPNSVSTSTTLRTLSSVRKLKKRKKTVRQSSQRHLTDQFDSPLSSDSPSTSHNAPRASTLPTDFFQRKMRSMTIHSSQRKMTLHWIWRYTAFRKQ